MDYTDWRLHCPSVYIRKIFSGRVDFIKISWRLLIRQQIPEFIAFEARLENSLQHDFMKVEHLRMRLMHEPISSDIIDMELIELKFIFDRCEPEGW